MRLAGLVMKDLGGYEWHEDRLRPTHHKELRSWLNHFGSAWRTHVNAGFRRQGDVSGSAITSFPDGFECYDPFQKEPALFAIAARLCTERSEASNRKAIVEFANKWGDIANVPEKSGTDIRTWIGGLISISDIGRYVGGPEPVSAGAVKAIADDLRHLLIRATLNYNVIDVPSGLQSEFVAVGLENSLKIQAAMAVIDGWVLLDCAYCNQPIAPSINRADKVFCSDSCRVQAFKQRRKKAIDMHARGKSLRQIVAAVDSDVKTIRRWLKLIGKQNVNRKQ